MVSPIKNIFQPIFFPFIKKNAKYLGIATFGTGGAIGFFEGVQFTKTNHLIEEQGCLPRAFNKVVPISYFTLTGIILAPFVVTMTIHDLYHEILSKKSK